MALATAFDNPVFASQSVFRAVMDALARPGERKTIAAPVKAPKPLDPAAAAIMLTLLDYETPVWLDPPLAKSAAVTDWLTFHTGAPITTAPELASFALIADPANAPAFERFNLGAADYPDRSATLVMQVEGFSGETVTLSGPGIARTATFAASPLPADFAAQLAANRELFPRGVDLLFAHKDAVVALPRSVRIVEGSR